MRHVPVVNAPQPRMNFYADTDRDILWIIHRKVAGTSLRKALDVAMTIPAEEALPHNASMRTITVVRHPWDRITSGMFNIFNGGPEVPFAQRISEEITSREGPHAVDWHFWPQWYVIDGFRVDDVILFENLAEGWCRLQSEYDLPELGHFNKGDGHDWRLPEGEPFDWSPLLPWYEPDFAFCEEWKRA